jgi:histidyl-tRNA synthetase
VPISGFPELLPSQRFVELAVLDSLRTSFELHGFAPLETPAVETVDTLLGKGEVDKEVYVLSRLHAGEEDADPGLGLRYDLTVPFARFVVENAGHLQFPFRRYQIQPVWRGERPQAGRYRQFTQADIDIVGQGELPFHHDVEVARVMAEALSHLDFLPPARIQINNRRLIEGFYRGLGATDPAAVMRVIDKLDKLPYDTILALLVTDAGLTDQQAATALALAEIRTSDTSFLDAVKALGVTHELLTQGLDELTAVIDGCAPIAAASGGRVTVEADLRIARGLDYYTGTVFETRLTGHESLGSICSGGRYDSLASDGRTTYPGVGISFGLSRTIVPLLLSGMLAASRSVPSVVLVALENEDSRSTSDDIAQALRARGIPTEVAASPHKFGKQIRYAERRGIPFVWFPGTNEVKDIRSGDQKAADPAAWTPPTADLKPQVLTKALPTREGTQ